MPSVTVTLRTNEWSILRLSHLPLGAHHSHYEREQPDAKTPHSSYSEHCHTYVICIFLLVKTDEVQLILASAVIPMPGACVFPTTTSRSSAGGDDGSGRCSTQPHRKFKGEPKLQVTQGHMGGLLVSLNPGDRDGKVSGSNPRGRGGKCGWGCLSVRSLDTRQPTHLAVPEQGT